MNFYNSESPQNPLSQGDILESVPFSGFTITGVNVVKQTTAELTDLTNKNHTNGMLVANFETSFGMILNQSCDLDDHSTTPVLVARIRTLEEAFPKYKDKTNDPKSMDEFIRTNYSNAGKSPTTFYLPSIQNMGFSFPKSVVYLLEVQTFPSVDRKALATLHKLSLNKDALNALQAKIAYCFGRLASPDDLFYSKSEWEFKQSKAQPTPNIPQRVMVANTQLGTSEELILKPQSLSKRLISFLKKTMRTL